MPPDQLRVATYVEKGGVAKTTTSAHVAASAVVNHDLDSLIIDLAGTQNDIAAHFGLDEVVDADDDAAPISVIFGDQWNIIRDGVDDVIDRMIYETDEGVDVIPSDMGLEGADNNLANVPIEERYTKLHQFIDEDLDFYDLVVLDLPGKSDNIAINGLVAAGDVLAPVKPGAFERNQLGKIEEDLAVIRDQDLSDVGLPRDLQLQQIVVTMYQQNRRLQEQFIEHVDKKYPDLVAPEVVAHTEDILHAQDAGQTLFAMDDDELYATGERAREAYRANTADLLDRLTHE